MCFEQICVFWGTKHIVKNQMRSPLYFFMSFRLSFYFFPEFCDPSVSGFKLLDWPDLKLIIEFNVMNLWRDFQSHLVLTLLLASPRRCSRSLGRHCRRIWSEFRAHFLPLLMRLFASCVSVKKMSLHLTLRRHLLFENGWTPGRRAIQGDKIPEFKGHFQSWRRNCKSSKLDL